MNNETLAILIFGAAAIYYMTPKAEPENMFFVPGVGDVPESELPEYGYIKYNGKWFKKSDIIQAAQSNGMTSPGNIDVNTQQGFDIFMTLLNAGLGLTSTIIANTVQRKADLIEQIETKYTLTVSSSYDPNFPFTTTQLNALTIPKLEKVLSGDFAVSGIKSRPDINHNVQCYDGQYTNSKGRGSCSYHGGVRQTGGRAPWIENL